MKAKSGTKKNKLVLGVESKRPMLFSVIFGFILPLLSSKLVSHPRKTVLSTHGEARPREGKGRFCLSEEGNEV
jgi:hypothetical protein